VIYRTKHPEWKEEDIKEIDALRDIVADFYELWLKSRFSKGLYEKTIKILEEKLEEEIEHYKINHTSTETSKVSFARSLERLTKTWEEARATDNVTSEPGS